MEGVRKPTVNEFGRKGRMHKQRGGREEVERSGKQSMRLRNTRAVLRGLLEVEVIIDYMYIKTDFWGCACRFLGYWMLRFLGYWMLRPPFSFNGTW